MTDRQKLEIAAAKARKELRALAMSEDATAEQIAEATAKVDNLEARAAALPDDPPEPEPNKDGDEDAEARELRELAGRVEVRRYIGAAMDGGAVDGAEGEYNAALGMGAGSFPLRLLAPEARATTDTDAGVNQGTWLDRLFAKTCAAHVGVSFRSAGPGVAAYPVTTAGASAAQRGRGEAAVDAAWTVGVTEVKPSRNAVRAVFSVEDAARLRGLEDALRRDLRMALTEGIDKAVFLGDAGANEDAGDITGLTSLAFGKLCREAGIAKSMGSVGDAYDNAMCESFFATLECELIDRQRFRTRLEARREIFSFIEGFYNTRRLHSALGYLSPANFERLNHVA